MKHPISKEQLTFERREYRADPIEGPQEHNVDFLIVIAAVVGLITAVVIAILEKLNT
jgi:hypothetical protein